MRNQLRLLLKDHLDAGPKRRSTVTKVVHDAHQIFPVWRNQIREKVRDVNLKNYDNRSAVQSLFVIAIFTRYSKRSNV